MWFLFQLLAVTLWAEVNTLDSLLVHRYKKSPLALMWNQAYFSIFVLALMGAFMNVSTTWMLPLFLAGMCAYFADLLFFVALKHIDVSVTNIAWVLLSVTLSIAGIFWFHETWSAQESIGVVLILLSITFLSLWQHRISGGLSLLLLPAMALIYTPFYVGQEAALGSGEHILAVFYWSVLGREMTSFALPLLVPRLRRTVLSAGREADVTFFAINAAVIGLFLTATYLTAMAFEDGPVSLVGIVGNVQPFIVLLVAFIKVRHFPRFAPKELIDSGSMVVKIGCFLIAFLGLALLAISQ